MYAKTLKVLEGDEQSHNKDDSSDNDTDPFTFSSKDDKAPQARRRNMLWYPQLEFVT